MAKMPTQFPGCCLHGVPFAVPCPECDAEQGTEPVVKTKRKEKEMDRSEHMAWCKKRALEYVETGDLNQAFTSMASDLRKHPETEGHSGIQLGLMLLMGGQLNSAHEMRKFIEGFN